MHIQKQGIGFLNNDFFSGEAVAEDIVIVEHTIIYQMIPIF